jgi:hypothetical protein
MSRASERPIFGNDIGLISVRFCVSCHIGLNLVGYDVDGPVWRWVRIPPPWPC